MVDLRQIDVPFHSEFIDNLEHSSCAFSETVVFSWVVYKSRVHRDRVNAKVMKDERMHKTMEGGVGMPFDMKRVAYGGFKVIVDAN